MFAAWFGRWSICRRLFATIASSAILYIITPRLPHWQISSVWLESFWMKYSPEHFVEIQARALSSITISTTLGLPLEMYDSYITLGYPDKIEGSMQWIGHLERGHPAYICREKQCDDATDPDSFPLTLHPSSEVLLLNNYVHVTSLPIATSFRMIYDSLFNAPYFHINVVTAVVGHVKTVGNPLPITIGFTCENRLALNVWPSQIVDRECSIDLVQAGWSNLNDKADNLMKKVDKRFYNTGIVFAGMSAHEVENNVGFRVMYEEKRLIPWLEV